MFVHLTIAITAQLLYGCWISIQPVQSQTKRVITRHNLPLQRLEQVYGSQENASCTELYMDRNNTCAGTSVLNDGIIPAVDAVNTSNSTWASDLFTLRGTYRIRLSFEVDSENHDRMELAVFNCPEMGIGFPSVSVYFDSSFRPDRDNRTLGTFIMESQLMNTSCDYLLVFCVQYNTTLPPTRFINLVIANDISVDYVFLGEVTFVDGGTGGDEPYGPAAPTTDPVGADSSDGPPGIIVTIVIVLVLLVVIIVVVVVVSLYLKTHKWRHESDMRSQRDPVIQMHTKPSPVQQNPTDIEMVYAVPDKKKKASKKAPAVPPNTL